MSYTLILGSILTIFSSIIVFVFCQKIYKKVPFPFLIPLLTSTIILVVILKMLHITYSTYMIGGKWISDLLGPAVVALAFPLYKQRHMVLKNFVPIIVGIFCGGLAGMVGGLILGNLFGFSKELLLSELPKSITTPVAMQITGSLGGNPSTTIVFTMIAGFSGTIIGPMILKLLKVTSEIGNGIALGSAAHGLGTSKSIEYGTNAVSFSSVAMTLSAIIGSIVCPVIVSFML